MRRRDLCAVDEVRLEAVVVWRIVARGDDHAGVRLVMAHRKAELRRRARAVEDERLAPESDPGGRGEFAEMPGEMPHIVRDDDAGLRRVPAVSEVFRHVAVQADHGAQEGEIVEQVAADVGVLGRALGVDLAGFRSRCFHPDRAAAHAARAELEVAKETVVQFAPFPAGDQFLQALLCPAGQTRLEPRPEIIRGTTEQLAILDGLGDLIGEAHGRGIFQRSLFIVHWPFRPPNRQTVRNEQ